MEQLKSIKDCLISSIQYQVANLSAADYEELGAAVDMVKDLAEAEYYCSITKAMEESEKNEKAYYTEPVDSHYHRDMDRSIGKMYYTEPYDRAPVMRDYPNMGTRDYREGRSPVSRKMYMESKELHKDTPTKMKDLEKYMQELSEDIVDMIQGATPEEKQLLHKKISTLASKIE